jgi:hypothetical protein
MYCFLLLYSILVLFHHGYDYSKSNKNISFYLCHLSSVIKHHLHLIKIENFMFLIRIYVMQTSIKCMIILKIQFLKCTMLTKFYKCLMVLS